MGVQNATKCHINSHEQEGVVEIEWQGYFHGAVTI